MKTLTILTAARKKGVKLSPKQLHLIGEKAGTLYREITGTAPEKVPQAENGRLMKVNAYPDEFEQILDNLVEQAKEVSYQKSI